MKRAILVLLFLFPLPSCGFDEGGDDDEMSECADGACEMDYGGELAGAERDQAPDPTAELSPDELPTFDWKPDTAAVCGTQCTSIGGNCCFAGTGGNGICCGAGGMAGRDVCLPTQWGPMCCACIIPSGTGCGDPHYCGLHCSSIDPETGECIGYH